MRKPRPDSPLAALTDCQQDELFAVVNSGSYGRAVEWANTKLGVATSTASLGRWRSRQARARLRRELRQSVEASTAFDGTVDQAVIDRRFGNALKSSFFAAVSTRDQDAILDFAKVALEYNSGERNKARLDRELAAERRARAADEQAEALRREVAELRAALESAGRANAADPAAVAAEVDKLLGRAPK
jgi:hypothetical protein